MADSSPEEKWVLKPRKNRRRYRHLKVKATGLDKSISWQCKTAEEIFLPFAKKTWPLVPMEGLYLYWLPSPVEPGQIFRYQPTHHNLLNCGTFQENFLIKNLRKDNAGKKGPVIINEIIKPEKRGQHWHRLLEEQLFEDGYRSYILIPLPRGDTHIGIVVLCARKPGYFTADTVQSMAKECHYLAQELDNRKMAKQISFLSRNSDIMADLSQQLLQLHNVNRSIQKAVRLIRTAYQCDFCVYREYDSIHHQFVPKYYDGLSDELGEFLLNLVIGKDMPKLFNLLLNTDQPSAVENIPYAGLVPPDWINIFGLKSGISITFNLGDQILGFLGIYYTREFRKFTEDELRLARDIKSWATLGFENARLYEKLLEQSRISKSIVQIARSLTEAREPEQIFKRITELTRENTRGDYCILLQWDADDNVFFPLKLDGISEPFQMMANSERFFRQPDKLWWELSRQNKPISWSNTDEQPYIPSTWFELAQIKYIQLVPLFCRDRLVGLLHIGYHHHPAGSLDYQMALLEGIAQYATIALDNSILIQRDQQLARDMEIIQDIGKSLTRMTTLEELMPEIYDHIRRIIHCDAFFIAEYNPGEKIAHLLYLVDEKIVYPNSDLPLEKGSFLRKVLDSGQPFLLNRNEEEFLSPDIPDMTSNQSHIGNTSRRSASLIFVPMKIQERTIGFLSIQSYRPKMYRKIHLQMLQAIASQIAIALENSRNFQEQENAIKRMELIVQDSSITTLSTPLENRLDNILNIIKTSFNADVCIIREYLPDGLKLMECIGIDKTSLSPHIVSNTGVSKTILDTLNPLAIYDLPIHPLAQESDDILNHPFKSYLGCPMIHDGMVKGILEIYTTTHNRLFTESDARHLQVIANYAMVSIENARLYQERQKFSLELDALSRISNFPANTHSLPQRLSQLMQQIVDMNHADAGSLFLLDDKKENLVVMASCGHPESTRGFAMKIGEGIAGKVFQSKQVMVEENTGDSVNSFQPDTYNRFNIKATLGIPLQGFNDAIGVIHLDFFHSRQFSNWELSLLGLLGSRVGFLIENYLLNREAELRTQSLVLLQESLATDLNVITYPEMCQAIPKVASGLANADFAILLSHPEHSGDLIVSSIWGEEETKLSFSEINTTPFLEGLKKLFQNNYESILFERSATGANPIQEKCLLEGFNFALLTPLLHRDKFWGILGLYRAEQSFNSYDRQIIELTINHILVALEKSRLYENLQDEYLQVVKSLARIVDMKDSATRDHSSKTADYATILSRAVNLSAPEIARLETAALLHDIGKVSVPDAILQKPSSLTDDEYEIIKKHPALGAEILHHLYGMKEVSEMVLHHHEHFDGSGYPDGLKGKEIPIGSRILSIVDAFHAMTSDRYYRPKMPIEEAAQELIRSSGAYFDPELVDIFLNLLHQRGEL